MSTSRNRIKNEGRQEMMNDITKKNLVNAESIRDSVRTMI